MGIIEKAFSLSLKDKGWRFFIGTLSGCILMATGGKIYFNLSLPWSIILGFSVLLCFFTVRFVYNLTAVLKQRRLHAHDSLYGEVMVRLVGSVAGLNHIMRAPTVQADTLIEVLVGICNDVKKSFEQASGFSCSVSIKVFAEAVIGGMDDCSDASVINFCRDFDSRYRDNDLYKASRHTIARNTAYQIVSDKILSDAHSCYYANQNVRDSADYLSSSRSSYKDGTLPYNSEIVYPIMPLLREAGDRSFLGFLCVDCAETYDLNSAYLVSVLGGVTDRIYDLLIKERFSTQKNERHEAA